MFLIRQSKPEDVSTLVKMAKMVYFINLPPNEQFILHKIEHSGRCFSELVPGGQEASVRPRRSGGEGSGHAAMEHDSEQELESERGRRGRRGRDSPAFHPV